MSRAETKTIRALGLCSGGLDSMLAALVLRRQGIQVEWITFETPFFTADKARRAAAQTGIALRIQDITADYLVMLKNPPAGYGKNMNPCMDCHTLMFRKAGELMLANGYDFLFSGEVLGQRPMSQTASSLRYVEKHSGFDGNILRPLSAQRLPATVMEQEGRVDRAQLLALSGRSRKPQMDLAAQFGIVDFPTPAGGCLLTDPGYSRRLRDLMDHEVELTPAGLHLLQHGRHLRLNATTKIVVGRTQQDNEQIQKLVDPQCDVTIKVKGYPGPTVLMPGGGLPPLINLAACICAGYSKAPKEQPCAVQISSSSGVQTITILPITPQEAKRFLIL
ncbi:MAG: tRNA 4-thiouridine(8) synthase ThiI [Desulfobacteraceae bacterium]|nr:tRNA 4-thiouridine(8) synthase ThiI [Desulfobacteraceae bacterium]